MSGSRTVHIAGRSRGIGATVRERRRIAKLRTAARPETTAERVARIRTTR